MSHPRRHTASIGVGMPAMIHLDDFGRLLWAAFDTPAYLVGTAATGKDWRDVDVRLILDDDVFDALFGGYQNPPRCDPKWAAMSAAFAELGRQRTGLPIDFQFQRKTEANAMFGGFARVPLGLRHRPGQVEGVAP